MRTRGNSQGIHGGQLKLLGQHPNQVDTGGVFDFGHLCAAHHMRAFGLRHGMHGRGAIGKGMKPIGQLHIQTQGLQHFKEVNARSCKLRIRKVNPFGSAKGGLVIRRVILDCATGRVETIRGEMPTTTTTTTTSSSGGGGATGFAALLLLPLAWLRRRR